MAILKDGEEPDVFLIKAAKSQVLAGVSVHWKTLKNLTIKIQKWWRYVQRGKCGFLRKKVQKLMTENAALQKISAANEERVLDLGLQYLEEQKKLKKENKKMKKIIEVMLKNNTSTCDPGIWLA